MLKSLIPAALAITLLGAPLAVATPANAASLHPSIVINQTPSINETKGVAQIPTRTGFVTVHFPLLSKKEGSALLFITRPAQGILYIQPVTKAGRLALIHMLKIVIVEAKLGKVYYTTPADLLQSIKATVAHDHL